MPSAPRATPSPDSPPTPTAEQAAVIDAAAAGHTLVVQAGAGTGKTSTLAMAASVLPGSRGVYLAYNRSIAMEAAGKFPPHITCATAHSLAYRAIGYRYKRRLNGPRVTAHQVAAALGVTDPLRVNADVVLGPYQLARLARDAVDVFCQSADVEIAEHHIKTPTGIEDPDAAALRKELLPFARIAWADVQAGDGRLKFSHDHYLKLWALTRPVLDADVVMLDEAQDANPVIANLVCSQPAQRIAVGDSCQQLYAWRGAIDALDTWPADVRLQLSQSWRFGPAIAAEANTWLGVLGACLRLTGNPALPSSIGQASAPDAVLCRTNAEAISRAMAALDAGLRPALVGGGNQILALARAALTLQAGKGTSHPELLAFTTWSQLRDYVTHDDSASDLRTFVRVIDQHGPEEVVTAVDQLTTEQHADVVLSTAHKAKGREWPTVAIAADFPEPKPDQATGQPRPVAKAEAMLAYVAVTRARQRLDNTGLAWIHDHPTAA